MTDFFSNVGGTLVASNPLGNPDPFTQNTGNGQKELPDFSTNLSGVPRAVADSPGLLPEGLSNRLPLRHTAAPEFDGSENLPAQTLLEKRWYCNECGDDMGDCDCYGHDYSWGYGYDAPSVGRGNERHLAALSNPKFGGSTYSQSLDQVRLTGQLKRVRDSDLEEKEAASDPVEATRQKELHA